MNFTAKWHKMFAALLACVIAVQPTHVAGAQGADVIVPEGTRLRLVTAQEVSSKVAQVGDTVNFTVDEDLVVGGRVIVRKGTPATGTVMNAEKSGRMGKAGRLGIRVESTTTAGGEPIKLRAAKGQEGDDKSNSTFALSAVSTFFLLRKGGDATIKKGSKYEVYVAEGMRFRVEGESLVAVPAPAPAENPGGAAAPADTPATVYIYRPNKMLGKALEPSVFADGVELARMDNGRFLTLRLAPGRHVIHMTDKKKGYDINFGAGEVYYFRVGIETGMWKGHGKLVLDENERGAKEVRKLKPLGDDKIKDRTMVAPAPPVRQDSNW
jgi:hypothetical protein